VKTITTTYYPFKVAEELLTRIAGIEEQVEDLREELAAAKAALERERAGLHLPVRYLLVVGLKRRRRPGGRS
jgi:hypothetical protein